MDSAVVCLVCRDSDGSADPAEIRVSRHASGPGRSLRGETGPPRPGFTRAALSTKANSYVQPSIFDMLAGASPASARDGWAE